MIWKIHIIADADLEEGGGGVGGGADPLPSGIGKIYISENNI